MNSQSPETDLFCKPYVKKHSDNALQHKAGENKSSLRGKSNTPSAGRAKLPSAGRLLGEIIPAQGDCSYLSRVERYSSVQSKPPRGLALSLLRRFALSRHVGVAHSLLGGPLLSPLGRWELHSPRTRELRVVISHDHHRVIQAKDLLCCISKQNRT